MNIIILSTAAHYGKGVYFALNSSYSLNDRYSVKDKNGQKHILVCTLLVGYYTKGSKDMKIAPTLPNDKQVSSYYSNNSLLYNLLQL